MFNNNDLSDLIKCIFRLRHKTVQEIAKEADIHTTNLTDAMGGRRPIPAEKSEAIYSALGMHNGMLKSDQVHYWVVGVVLDDLQYAVERLFVNGAELAGVWREGSRSFNLKRVVDNQVFFLYDPHQIVVVIRKRIGIHSPVAKPIGPEVLPKVKWRGGSLGAENMLSLPKDMFKQLEAGHIQNVEELRQILGEETVVTWDDCLDYIKNNYPNPKVALSALLRIE